MGKWLGLNIDIAQYAKSLIDLRLLENTKKRKKSRGDGGLETGFC